MLIKIIISIIKLAIGNCGEGGLGRGERGGLYGFHIYRGRVEFITFVTITNSNNYYKYYQFFNSRGDLMRLPYWTSKRGAGCSTIPEGGRGGQGNSSWPLCRHLSQILHQQQQQQQCQTFAF